MNKKFNRNKKASNDDEDSMLIFGYSCHLYPAINNSFKEQQLEPDAYQHLISWNGNEDLKIDRYDCRLYLHSLNEFDNYVKPNEESSDFTTAEKLEEEMCDEERYCDMYADIQKTEEDKHRKRGDGAEISFFYNDSSIASTNKTETNKESSSSEEEIEEPYVVPEGLRLPVGMNLPETMKQSVIIEKTAVFVVAKGPQMEIVIKLKQRNNIEQFGFLEFDNKLNTFYKYICKLIRENKYTPSPAPLKTRPKLKKLRRLEEEAIRLQEEKKKHSNALELIALHHGSDSENEGSSDDDGYLHPLLRSNTNPSKHKVDNTASASPTIGPMPQPKIEEPIAPDFNKLLSQLQSQVDNSSNVYSSLFKNLNEIYPGCVTTNDEEGVNNSKIKEEEVKNEVVYETDETKINEYNEWHLAFYDQPSPFLPSGPPVPIPPPPNLSSPLGIAARYVAINGGSSQQKLIDHNGDNCAFLFPSNLYYTYYQLRIRQIQWSLRQAYINSLKTQQKTINNTLTSNSKSQLLANMACSSKNISTTNQIQAPIELISFDEKHMPSIDENVSATFDGKIKETNNSENLLKQERKEKARLFMERILNEKLAAKKKQNEIETNLAKNEVEDMAASSSIVIVPSSSTEKNTKSTLAEIIQTKLQNVITSSPLLSAAVKNADKSSFFKHDEQHQKENMKKKRKKSSSREFNEEKSRKRKSQSRKKSRSRSRSYSNKSGDDVYEDSYRKKKKQHKSSQKHSRRHLSDSRYCLRS